MSINSTYPTYTPGSMPRHNAVVAPAPVIRHNTGKAEAAAILGRSTGGAKAKAAQENGKMGGRPEGS